MIAIWLMVSCVVSGTAVSQKVLAGCLIHTSGCRSRLSCRNSAACRHIHMCCVCYFAVHIYLCDDSPKDYKESYNGQTFSTVALRQQMIDALYQVHGIPVIRVTRVKGKGETNPKSANLNNCLKQIYGDAIPPDSEVVAVFDADQAAHSHFFTATLPWMDAGDDVALVQSPQVLPTALLPLPVAVGVFFLTLLRMPLLISKNWEGDPAWCW